MAPGPRPPAERTNFSAGPQKFGHDAGDSGTPSPATRGGGAIPRGGRMNGPRLAAEFRTRHPVGPWPRSRTSAGHLSMWAGPGPPQSPEPLLHPGSQAEDAGTGRRPHKGRRRPTGTGERSASPSGLTWLRKGRADPKQQDEGGERVQEALPPRAQPGPPACDSHRLVHSARPAPARAPRALPPRTSAPCSAGRTVCAADAAPCAAVSPPAHRAPGRCRREG
jgi:hypothetical protein